MGLAAGLPALSQVSNGVPKGYLRVLFFNQDSVLVEQRTYQLSQAASSGYEALQTGNLRVAQDGYVTVYVGNESAVDVFFDDITIEHRQGLQVQENQYDPWGLNLVGLDYTSSGIRGLNLYQYNGYELQPELGLKLTDYGARLYDAQLGHWHNVDPLADLMRRHSPYNYAFDNPIRFVDHDGLGPGEGEGKPQEPSLWNRFKGWASNLFSSEQGLGREKEPEAPSKLDPEVDAMFERMGQEALAKGDELKTPLGIMKEFVDLFTLSQFIPGEEGGSASTFEEAVGKTAKNAETVEEAGIVAAEATNIESSTLRVRHYTTTEGAAGIRRDGAINVSAGATKGVHVEVGPKFGKTSTGHAETGAYLPGPGKAAYVEFDVPRGIIEPTPWVGPRNTGLIPATKPLPINGANPSYHTIWFPSKR